MSKRRRLSHKKKRKAKQTKQKKCAQRSPPLVCEGDARNPEPVLLIHGTFAYDDRETVERDKNGKVSGDNRWWQRNSTFTNAWKAGVLYDERSGPVRYHVPAEVKSVQFLPWWLRLVHRFLRRDRGARRDCANEPEGGFHWSSANSEQARRQAAKYLLEHLRQLDERGPFHVIAHSHGCAVLWDALCLAGPWVWWLPCRNRRPLTNLRSWTTVGAPFLHFAPDWRQMWLAVAPALLFVGVVWYQAPWFADYWDQYESPTALGLASVWYAKAFAFLLSTLCWVFFAALLTGFLAALGQWLWYVVCKNAPNLIRPVRQRLCYDIGSVVLAALALWSAAWLPDAIGLTAWRPYRYLGWPFPTVGPNLWGPVTVWLWALLAALIAYLVLLKALAPPVLQWVSCRVRDAYRFAAWEHYHKRYYCLALADVDEAIAGLRASQRGFRDTLLPRVPQPWVADFSEHRRHFKAPEREFMRGSFGVWFFSYLLLPWAFVRDWLLYQLLYNGVFAYLIDTFVQGQVQRRAFGCDIAGLRPYAVSPEPFREEDEFNELDKRQLRRPQAVAPQVVRQAVTDKTNAAAAGFLQKVREQLHDEGSLPFDSPAGVQLGRFFKKAMGGDRSVRNALVHTSYFESTATLRALYGFLEQGRALGAPAPQAKPACDPTTCRAGLAAARERLEPARKERLLRKPQWGGRVKTAALKRYFDRVAGPMHQVFLFLVRTPFIVALAAVPAGLLYILGHFATYPHSRQYFLEWAADPDRALLVAENELRGAQGKQPTPQVVRWWVAKTALEEEESRVQALRRLGLAKAWKLWRHREGLAQFGAGIKSNRARVEFYADVAERYAELQDRSHTLEALALTRTEHSVPARPGGMSSPGTNYLQALVLAAHSLGENPEALDRCVLARLPEESRNKVEAVNPDYVKPAPQPIQPIVERLDTFWQAMRRATVMKEPRKALAEIRTYASAEEAQKRDRRVADERVRSMALFLAHERPSEISEGEWKLLLDEFVSLVDQLLCEVECDTDPESWPGRLQTCIQEVLAVWLVAQDRSDLLERARGIRACVRTRAATLPPDKATLSRVATDVAYAKSLRAAGSGCEVPELLNELVQDLDRSSGFSVQDRENLARQVAGTLARWGKFARAKHKADPSPKAQLEAAIQIMINELETRKGGRSPQTTASHEEPP